MSLLFAVARRAVLCLAAAGLIAGLAGCGGSSPASGSSTAAQTGPQGAGRGFALSAKVTACLKKQGVTLPRRPGGRPPGTGTSTNGAPPAGQAPPTGGRPPGGGPGRALSAKVRKALQACGARPPGRAPQAPTSTSS